MSEKIVRLTLRKDILAHHDIEKWVEDTEEKLNAYLSQVCKLTVLPPYPLTGQ